MLTMTLRSIFQSKKSSKSKVIMVTGASAGVGRAVVRELAEPGVTLGLIARGRDGLEGARKEAEVGGAKVHLFPLDVVDAAAVENAAAELERLAGPLDAWVNVAMASVFSPVHEMKADEYRRVTEVTYLGYVHGTLAALKRMRPRNKGVIIQAGSALAYRSIPLQSAYCAAKHAIVGFTESLRTELLHDKLKVQVVNVHLPAMNTPQFTWVKSRLPNQPQPVPPIYQPEVAARTIKWAIDHPRREYWVGYPTLKAIIGERLVPWYADRVLAQQGYASQQTNEPVSQNRQTNLWEPVPGDHGAHGPFVARSRPFSPQSWFSTRRSSPWALALASGLVSALAWRFYQSLLGTRKQPQLKAPRPAMSIGSEALTQ